jgi:nucleotide-binding universal stress UspA family protein
MFERLLIPLDFSPPSVHALHTARLHFPGARRLLLHIPGPERTHAPSALDLLESGTLLSEESDLARERLEQLAIEGEETQVATGLTAETILDAAQTWGADLIVMGTQGRQGLTRLVLGSVADAVVRGADIPVMTVRERRETPEQTD